MEPNPVTRKQLLALALDVQQELALHTNDFDDPEYSIMYAALEQATDTVHALVADTLHDSAVTIRKITEVITLQTGKLNTMISRLTAIKNFAGQAADVINAISTFLPYLA